MEGWELQERGGRLLDVKPARIVPDGAPIILEFAEAQAPPPASAARSSKATMLVILIIGFTAGPAVSL